MKSAFCGQNFSLFIQSNPIITTYFVPTQFLSVTESVVLMDLFLLANDNCVLLRLAGGGCDIFSVLVIIIKMTKKIVSRIY